MNPDDPYEYNATDPTEDDYEFYFRDREYWGVLERCEDSNGTPEWTYLMDVACTECRLVHDSTTACGV